MASVIGELEVLLTASSSGLTSALKTAESDLGSFVKTIGSGSMSLGGLSAASAIAGVGILGLVATIAGASVSAAASFDALMAKNAALTGMTTAEYKTMSNAILQMTEHIPQSANQLADALYYVESAGFHGADAIKVLTDSAKAASVGMTDTKTVADAVTSALNSYGLNASHAGEVTDILTKTVVEGNMQYSDLASSIGEVLPIASHAGVSLQEVGAAIAAMTRQGIDASRASTALRYMLESMISPTSAASKELAAMGLNADQLQKDLRTQGLSGALQDVTNQLKGVNTSSQSVTTVVGITKQAIAAQTAALKGNAAQERINLELQKLAIQNELTQAEASKKTTEQVAVTKVAGSGSGRHLVTTMETKSVTNPAAVSAVATYKAQIQALDGRLRQLGISTQQSELDIKKQTTAVKGSGGAAVNADQALSKLFGGVRGGMAAFALTGKAAQQYHQILGQINNSAGTTDKSFKKFVADNPQVAFKLLKNAVNEAAINLGNDLRPSILKVIEAITPLVQGLAHFIAQHPKLVAGVMLAVGAIGALLLVLGGIGVAILTIGPAIAGIGVVIGAVSGVFAGLGIILGIVASFISLPIILIVALGAAIVVLAYLVVTHFNQVKSFIGNALKVAGEAISSFAKTAVAMFTSLVNHIIDSVKNLPGSIVFAIGFIIGALLAFATTDVPKIIGNIITGFEKLPGQLWNILQTVVKDEINGWTNIWNWLKTNVPKLISDVITYFEQLPGKIFTAGEKSKDSLWKALQEIPGFLTSKAGEILQWGWNVGTAFIQGIEKALGGLGAMFEKGLAAGAKFIKGNSPPSEGPLRNIDKWGFNVGMAWVGGLSNALSQASPMLNSFNAPLAAPAMSAGSMGNYNAGTNMNTSNVTMNNTFHVQSQAEAKNVSNYLAWQLEMNGIV